MIVNDPTSMTLLRFHTVQYSSSCWINVLRVLGIFFGHALVTLHRFFKASFPSPLLLHPKVGDSIWQAADARARGFLIGATYGRTTLNGEGLQHQASFAG